MSVLLQVRGLIKGGEIWGSCNRLWERLWAGLRACKKRDGGGALAKRVTRVVGTWEDGIGGWSGRGRMPDWILP